MKKDLSERGKMDRLLFYRLERAQGEKVFTEGNLDYYSVLINGYRLTYALNKWRPDGLKMYVLGEELAKVLGFSSYAEMRFRAKLQYSRKMLSIKTLRGHFL